MLIRQLRITGRVQGVGFRYAMQREATRLGVGGWVRNRADGSVEAQLEGATGPVDELTAWARRGPRAAQVASLEIIAEKNAGPQPVQPGFELRPTV